MTAGAQDATFTIADDFDPEQPVPVAVWFHGQGGDATSRIDDPTLAALRAAGFSVLTGDMHGSNWGNQAAVDDLSNMLAWVAARFTVGPVLLFAGSMGGLASLNALHRGALDAYDVRGWYGTMPATNLADAYTDGAAYNFPTEIEAAYGFTGSANFAAATTGYDPAAVASAEWPLIRYRFLASPDDVTIPPVDHTDVLRANLPGGVVENSLLPTTGVHGSASHFNPTDLADFAARCLADG